jgi:hypothetical protein
LAFVILFCPGTNSNSNRNSNRLAALMSFLVPLCDWGRL